MIVISNCDDYCLDCYYAFFSSFLLDISETNLPSCYYLSDRVSGLTSLVRSSAVLSVAQWHSVKAGRYGSRLYVWLDDKLSTEAMLAHAYPHTDSNATLLLGKLKKHLLFTTWHKTKTKRGEERFFHCVRNLITD